MQKSSIHTKENKTNNAEKIIEASLKNLQEDIKQAVVKYLESTKQSHGRIITHGIDGTQSETKIDIDKERYLKFAVAVTIDI